MLTALLALVASAVFAGAAIYVSVAEQPARLMLDDRALLAEWKPSYKRGAAMQASLAMLGFLLSLLAWWQTGSLAFLAGALLMIAGWPWTFLAMMSTNKAILTTDPAKAGPHSRALIVSWGRLHLVRLGFGAFGTLANLWGCLAP